MLNIVFQDILGVSLAFWAFTSVILFPGYVIGWSLDLFDFRQRRILTRHIVAILISVAVIPILFYLLALFVSFYVVKWTVICFFILYLLILSAEIKKSKGAFRLSGRYPKIAFVMLLGWVSLSILSLVDLQWGDRLYNNVVSLDFATRVTLINAITRTGVPPVNPSYFPGNPEYITSLYYFWYIFCSVIDQLGGDFVDARMALIAGDIWAGLASMALIAFYIRIRNNVTGESAWKMAVIGISLLTISGLDIIPASILMLATRFSYGFMWPYGDIEHWNEQVTAWVGSLFWVPHHVAAMIACVTSFMIFQYHRNDHRKVRLVIVAGLAFSSAVGLSVWVTAVFLVFLGIWSIFLLVWKKDNAMFLLFLMAGLVALLFASPFLLGVLKGGTGGNNGIPFAFEIRRFRPLLPFVGELPVVLQNGIYLLLLPVNYFMELGFFFVVGILWFRQYRRREVHPNHFLIPEIILLSVVGFIGSCIRSNITTVNDFGWRAWLFGQFILLVWTVDLYPLLSSLSNEHYFIKAGFIFQKIKIKKLMVSMLLIGFATTVMDVALLRFFPVLVDLNIAGFPNTLSPDTRLGARTFDGRLAYEFINDKLSVDVIIQQNPLSEIDRIDRPSGLYSNRQFSISFNAPYNVPLPVLKARSEQIAKIFRLEHQDSWEKIDLLCQQYFIDVLVIGDQDPLWQDLPLLYQQRNALYKNRYYAVLPCGEFVSR